MKRLSFLRPFCLTPSLAACALAVLALLTAAAIEPAHAQAAQQAALCPS
jgi:hypothetical protein